MDFEQAYDDHLNRVYGFLAYRTGNRDDAEDLTQQTFERAWRAWRRFDPQHGKLSTWLITIARNLLIDHYRARSAHAADVALESVDAELLGEAAAAGADLGLEPDLARALRTLSEREREVLALRYGADLRSPEIAHVMGLTVSNVQQITSRSLRRLRQALEPEKTWVSQKTEVWTDRAGAVLESHP